MDVILFSILPVLIVIVSTIVCIKSIDWYLDFGMPAWFDYIVLSAVMALEMAIVVGYYYWLWSWM